MNAPAHSAAVAADQVLAGAASIRAYLPRLLLYPLRGAGLPVLVGALAVALPGLLSPLGAAAPALLLPWVLHYARAVVAATAAGRGLPPAPGMDLLLLRRGAVPGALLAVMIVASLWLWARERSPFSASVILALGAFLLPACLTLLALGRPLLEALNPLSQLQIVAGAGGVYLGLCALMALDLMAIDALAVVPVRAVCLAALLYLLLATCHGLGFAVLHDAERLGVQPPPMPEAPTAAPPQSGSSSSAMPGSSPDSTQASPPASRDRVREKLSEDARVRRDAVLAAVDAALAAGDVEAALAAVRAEPGPVVARVAFHDVLLRQLAQRGQPALITDQGRRLIAMLLAARDQRQALAVAAGCLDADSGFTLERVEDSLRLLGLALAGRDDALFERLAQALRESGPDRSAQVALDFLCARYWAERRGDAVRAREILRPLLHVRDHRQYPAIQAYARSLLQKPGAV